MKFQPIQELLETEMDRKEFMAYVGATALAVFGVSGLLKAITQNSPTTKKDSGYGGSAYGR